MPTFKNMTDIPNSNGNALKKLVAYWPLVIALSGFIGGWAVLRDKVMAQGREIREGTNINVIQTSQIAVLQERADQQKEFERETRQDLKAILQALRRGR